MPGNMRALWFGAAAQARRAGGGAASCACFASRRATLSPQLGRRLASHGAQAGWGGLRERTFGLSAEHTQMPGSSDANQYREGWRFLGTVGGYIFFHSRGRYYLHPCPPARSALTTKRPSSRSRTAPCGCGTCLPSRASQRILMCALLAIYPQPRGKGWAARRGLLLGWASASL